MTSATFAAPDTPHPRQDSIQLRQTSADKHNHDPVAVIASRRWNGRTSLLNRLI